MKEERHLGWFEDRKKQEEQKKADIARAGNFFSEKEKDYSSGLADRLDKYGKLDNSAPAPTEKSKQEVSNGPKTAREMIDDLRRDHSKKGEFEDMSEGNLSAVKGIADSFQNKDFLTKETSNQIAQTKQEHDAEEREMSDKLGELEKSIKNVGMVTSQKDFGGKKLEAEENLSSQDINARTAGFRNIGFFTDSERREEKKVTEKEKTEQDIEDLEKIDSMVSQYTNTGFMSQTKPEENGEGE